MNSKQIQKTPAIGLFTSICLVVASMVGTGVFTSLGFQVLDIKSGFALLSLWMVGGVFALCGALCYGELGAAMPRSGGEYHYLSQIYHPAIGFLSGWVSVTVGFAAPIAAAAMALGKYLSSAFPFPALPLELLAYIPDNLARNLPEKLASIQSMAIATFVVIAVSLIHSHNLKLGSRFQKISTLLKILLIVGLIGCGISLATPQDISFLPGQGDLNLIFSSPFAVSLVYVTYSYSGWNAAVYLASEVKQPEKNLPKALFWGTAVVMILYLLLNFIFLYSTPIEELAGQLEVGYIAADRIFGASGGKIMGLLIAFGLISSISSMVWAGPRVAQTIGEDIALFRPLARKNVRGIPSYAIFFQLAIVLVLLITASFESVITYLGFTLTFSSFITVLGLFVHRWKYPQLDRPYKTWGYPITPLIFLTISLWMLVFILMKQPTESLAGLGTIAFGLPFYFFGKAKVKVARSKS
ncbi:MAG: amino acid permease [Prochloraceae cyanobacterium]|nr:amino acid permease [Prochloraceae cyanobacterium]